MLFAGLFPRNTFIEFTQGALPHAYTVLIVTSLPKVIWEEGLVAAKVSHGAV